jgi:hypothetical protein
MMHFAPNMYIGYDGWHNGNSQQLETFPNWLIPVENKSYAGLPQHYAI